MPMSGHDLRDLLAERSAPARGRPLPEADLNARIRRARRRRAVAGTTGFAGVAGAVAMSVALAAGAISMPGLGIGEQGVAAKPGPTRFPEPKAVAPVPAEKLWPGAVHKVPVTLPDGKRFFPHDLLDDGTVLASSTVDASKTKQLWRYDQRTRRATPLARAPVPEKVTKSTIRLYPSEFAAGGGHIVWRVEYEEGKQRFVEIWTVSQAGGEPRPIAAMPIPSGMRGGVDRVAVGGGKAVWSFSDSIGDGGGAGVFEVPLTGGTPRQVAGSDDHHLLSWPWIGTPGGGESNMPAGAVRNKSLRNVVTGERVTARIRAKGAWSCGVTWCATLVHGSDPKRLPVAQRRNGAGARTLPYHLGAIADGTPPALDRFVVLRPAEGDHAVLYDIITGKAGDLGPPPSAEGAVAGARISNPAARLYATETGESFLIVNLAAIK